jgi:membrane-associated protease RseP (regulator of RpoE activity)
MNHFILFLLRFLNFFINLIFIVIIHEAGHLIVAKKLKCGVDIYSIGFGNPLWRKEYKETIYQFAPILLGGYCKLRDELSSSNDPYSFTNMSYRKKVAISYAGVLVNILTGLLVGYIGWWYGIYCLLYFGVISVSLGVTNALPIPALDGSYPILIGLEKIYGKEKGYAIMNKICKWGFVILMTLNIASLPWMFYWLWIGRL